MQGMRYTIPGLFCWGTWSLGCTRSAKLGGWQAVAFATRTLGGRPGHSISTNSVNLFSLGQHKERTQVVIDNDGVSLCSKVMDRC